MVETFSSDELALVESAIASVNFKFMDAITESVESGLYTEEAKDSLMVKLKKFIADIITQFMLFTNNIKSEFSKKVTMRDIEKSLDDLYKKASLNPNGKFEVPDIDYLLKIYEDMNIELKKYARKFATMDYKHTEDIENDIKKFDGVLKDYEEDMVKAINKKRILHAKEVKRYIEDLKSGRDRTLKLLDNQISLFKQMQGDCDIIAKRMDVLGPEIIPKKVGFIRKMIMNIQAFFRKWCSKIISTFVFVFA